MGAAVPGALEKEWWPLEKEGWTELWWGENGGPREDRRPAQQDKGGWLPVGNLRMGEHMEQLRAEGGRVTRPEGLERKWLLGEGRRGREGGREGEGKGGRGGGSLERTLQHPPAPPPISGINSPDVPLPLPLPLPRSQTSGSRRTGNAP